MPAELQLQLDFTTPRMQAFGQARASHAAPPPSDFAMLDRRIDAARGRFYEELLITPSRPDTAAYAAALPFSRSRSQAKAIAAILVEEYELQGGGVIQAYYRG